MRFSPLVYRVAGRSAAAWDLHVEARRRQQAGEDIILLTVGDPDQAPPEAVIEATVVALRGYPALREAIASRVARRSGQPCTPDNVSVVPGAQGGVYCAVQCLAGPGDEIIVGEPIYTTYEAVIGASGAQMVTFPLRPETGFHPDLDALGCADHAADARRLDQQPA
jgi:arginine:pyruvate transaminase